MHHRLALAATLAALLAVSAAPAAEAASATEVRVGLLVINFGSYDVNKGTYVMDFYLWLKWEPATAPEGFTPEKFEFMNGRASAKEKIFDETDANGTREIWYRIQANLYSEPRFDNYPYDTQTVAVLFEDSVNQLDALRYAPLADESGLGDDVRVAGWRVKDVSFGTTETTYKFGETYHRAVFTVTVEREPTSTTLKAFLPPVAFLLVSALSFFFHPSKVAQRLTLGTSMLISAVMFHISQTMSLPPLAELIYFDKVMICVYLFLAGSLVVTTLVAIDEDFWKDRDYTRPINFYGGVASFCLAAAAFAFVTWL
jgi:hypothetical protein